MLSGRFDELAWQIISLLLDENLLTVAEIDARLSSRFNCEHSLSTVYRRIADLRDAQVVFSSRRRLALNHVWVDQMTRLLTHFQSRSPSGLSAFLLPKREGEKKHFSARSLLELDPLWNSLLVEVSQLSEKKEIFGYNSRAWYPAAIPESELALYGTLHRKGVSTRLVFGKDESTEQAASRRIKSEGLKIALARAPLFGNEDRVVWASPQFVLECRIPAKVSLRLSDALENSGRAEEIQRRTMEAFLMPADCSLTVYKSRARAREIIDKIGSAPTSVSSS